MTDNRRYGVLPAQPELALCQILQEAQHRWLRPTEVCEILRNYRKFKLTPDPPQKPQSGSLFLFDRKALRYFRKDGHIWRKKKDGKTVREAHERLKAGSIDVLHCYYAHGEDNENFQRRSYWMLEGAFEHIVLVHYREVKEGSRSSGMRSPNSYSTDGISSPTYPTQGTSRVVAASSPQTSPLVSPRASTPNATDWNGHTYSPEYDEPESSDDTDHCHPQEFEPHSGDQGCFSRGLNGSAGLAGATTRSLQPCASFSARNQNGVGVEGKPPTSLYNVGGVSVMQQGASELEVAQGSSSKQDNGTLVPPGGFDLLEWNEYLKRAKIWGVKGGHGVSEREVISSPNWADVMQQRATQQQQNPVESVVSSGTAASYGHRDSKMETTALPGILGSMQGLMGVPFPVIDAAHPQGLAESESLKITPEMLSNLTSELHPVGMDSLSAVIQMGNKQHSNISHWRAVFEQLDDNGHGQSGSFGGFESEKVFWNQSQQPQIQLLQGRQQDQQPSLVQDELGRCDASNIKDVSQLQSCSQVFKDFQADTPSEHEEHANFKKLDSFGRWMNQEIGGDAENSLLTVSSDSATYWASALEDQSTAEEVSSLSQQMQLDVGLRLSLSHEQCFSILDFSPENASSSAETKVLITGVFLDTLKDPSEYKWCCMFGEVEVPAEFLHHGVLRCKAPPHAPGRVPFYITRNDRVACSEVREFEYHADSKIPSKNSLSSIEDLEGGQLNKEDMLSQIRLARMLSSGSKIASPSQSQRLEEATGHCSNLSSLTSDCYEEWAHMEDCLTGSSHCLLYVKEQLVQKILKEKLQDWLVNKAQEEGKGASVLDGNGLGVLHMGAALGYNWAISPVLAAGVSINFRDSRGWTALHWAAHCGREKMVVALLAAGAAPGAKTDPTPKFPAGQTPADLASIQRHKGIAGYLAESSLTSHLSALTLKESMMDNISAALAGDKAVEAVSERTIVQPSVGESEDQLSLQDSLAAVRNAAQAAARIQSAFRVRSFRKRQEACRLQEDEYGISNEQARYIVAAQKTHKSSSSYHEEVFHSAAVRIQQKFRGWKGRRDFLLFRQRVVKIQAHVRGHQVRKHYRKIIWSVGIVEKAILRWRRKGKGLRGFCADGPAKNRVKNEQAGSDGDDDFLKAGRKQTEAGLEKALSRVQSMVKSREARDQYRRLLESFQKAKVDFGGNASDASPNTRERPMYGEDFFMSITDQ